MRPRLQRNKKNVGMKWTEIKSKPALSILSDWIKLYSQIVECNNNNDFEKEIKIKIRLGWVGRKKD